MNPIRGRIALWPFLTTRHYCFPLRIIFSSSRNTQLIRVQKLRLIAMPPFLHRSYTVIALRRLLARGSQCHKSSSSSSPTSPTLSMRESLALLFSNHYFPPTTHAVAYGSAVFPQLLLSCGKPKDMGHHHDNNHQHQITDGVSNNIDADNKDKMVDLFLVVDDPLQWHTQNMHMNPHHYSFFFRTLNGLMHSASAVRWMQTRFSPYVYFNTDVRVGGVVR